MTDCLENSPPCATAQRSHDPARSTTVLLVDDDESVRKLITKFLTLAGYRVLNAASGPCAMPLWREFGEEIDLLLTDVVLPERINGLELARRLQAERTGLPVLFTSGYDAEVAGLSGVLQEGINFLQKPYRPEQLLAAVRAVLTNSACGAGALC